MLAVPGSPPLAFRLASRQLPQRLLHLELGPAGSAHNCEPRRQHPVARLRPFAIEPQPQEVQGDPERPLSLEAFFLSLFEARSRRDAA